MRAAAGDAKQLPAKIAKLRKLAADFEVARGARDGDSLGGIGTLVRDELLATELPGVQVLVVLRADAVGGFPASQGTPAATTG